MKKLRMLVLLCTLVLLPFGVRALEYNSLSFEEALAEEEIEEAFDDYSLNDDQITIYLFRGKGCTYCRAYLEYMNSITEEYGKYFKMVSYEVWNDDANSKLMEEVSEFLDKPATGVPYIIIGDKVFAGYSDEYDEEIKTAIKDLYDTDKADRYDVFKEMAKESKTTDSSNGSINNVVWNLVFVVLAVAFISIFVNFKFKQVNEKIDDLSELLSKKKER